MEKGTNTMNRRRSARPRHFSFRSLGWMAVVAMVAGSLMPVGVLAVGPGDNGAGQPTGGPTSTVTINGSVTGTGNIASISQSVVLNCDDVNATSVSGSITTT